MATTTIKIKDDNFKEIKCCDHCPFVQYQETWNEWGEAEMCCIVSCGLTGDDIGDTDDLDWEGKKLETCPIISVTHEE